MKHHNISTRVYNIPSISVIEVAVEMGFEVSMPGMTISPWEEDDGTLEL